MLTGGDGLEEAAVKQDSDRMLFEQHKPNPHTSWKAALQEGRGAG